MQHCHECNESFIFKDIFNSGLLGYFPITCKKCGLKHKITLGSRVLLSLLIVGLPMILSNLLKTFLPVNIVILYLLLVSPMIFIHPFLMKYKPWKE